jgi:hypothetical protein
LAVSFPLKAAFAVSHRFWSVVFIFIKFQEVFDFLHYFFYYPVITEQCFLRI